jgi:hypothetical protein
MCKGQHTHCDSILTTWICLIGCDVAHHHAKADMVDAKRARPVCLPCIVRVHLGGLSVQYGCTGVSGGPHSCEGHEAGFM